LSADSEGDEELAYGYLDAWLSPETGKFLIEVYGYGHANEVSFEIVDPALVEALGFPLDPIDMLSDGMMIRPFAPDVLQKMIALLEDVQIGN